MTILLNSDAPGAQEFGDSLENNGHSVVRHGFNEDASMIQQMVLDPPPDPLEPAEPPAPIITQQGFSQGVCVVMFTFVAFCGLLCGGAAGYLYRSHTTPPTVDELRESNAILANQAQSESVSKQAELQVESVRRDTVLREKIIANCVEKGRIPVLIQGNIDCK